MVKDGIVLGKRYNILSKIGTGGMADVYKGKDIMLNRYVAVKVLKKEYKENEAFVKKFHSEAQAAAGLLNPNIVNVYDVGTDRGLHYMVMELVDGITLKEYIEKKGRIAPRELISIAIQMCGGISAAHQAGLIHRDIKPQNIMISRDGKVKVTDFGIAKAVTSNTVTTNAMGSVHYSSPEQVRGGFSDQKSDIYSIGITLYEMATGRIPFDGDSTVAIAMKHLKEEITPPSEYNEDIPYSLEQIILKCTQKNAERRYKNVDELIKDLKHSMVDPEGDFVYIPPLNNADTVIITDDDLDDIRHSYDDDEEYDDDDDYDDDDYDDDDDDDYDDEDEDDYEDFKKRRRGHNEDVNPRMSKLTKILAIVAAVIILAIVGFAVAKAAGIFKSGSAISTSTKDTVTVPDVTGMTEEEAKKTLNAKNLGFEVTSREESEEYEEGLVCSQTPASGKKVNKNTKVTVVVSSGLVGQSITIPDVTGMSEDDALKALNSAGFKNVSSSYSYSDSVAEGNVISTTPSANTKGSKDTKITMTVSKGAEKQTVPDVTGKTEADAQSALSSVGLTGSVTYEYSSSVEQGKVISQSVTAGKKVAPGTTVGLVVSQGEEPPEKVTVPPITGSSLENARQLIKSAGLAVGSITYQYSDSVSSGCVISCDPGDGSSVDDGSTVNLVISQGPESYNGNPSDDSNNNNSSDNTNNGSTDSSSTTTQ